MAITTQLVGKLGGGELKWSSQSFPQRTLAWNGTSATETIALPAGKDVVAYFVCEVISGPHANSYAHARSREKLISMNLSTSLASLPAVGKHTSGLFGLTKNASNRDFDITVGIAYQGPTMTYKITVYWAEIPLYPLPKTPHWGLFSCPKEATEPHCELVQ